MKFFKNHAFLLSCLIGFKALLASDIAIHKISEADILQAKNELAQTAQIDQILRRVIITGAAGLGTLAVFNLAKWSLNFNQEEASVKFFGPKNLSEAYLEIEKRLAGLEKKNTSNWVMTGAGFGIQTFVLPALLKRCVLAFSSPNIKRFGLTELDLLGHFERLKDAQINWQNPNWSNAELESVGKETVIKACDQLIGQIAYMIAYIRYVVPNHQEILSVYADQLQLATYEFACNAEKLIISNQKKELADIINLFRASFTVSFNNILIFNQ